MLDSLGNIYLRDKVGFITTNESREEIAICLGVLIMVFNQTDEGMKT